MCIFTGAELVAGRRKVEKREENDRKIAEEETMCYEKGKTHKDRRNKRVKTTFGGGRDNTECKVLDLFNI